MTTLVVISKWSKVVIAVFAIFWPIQVLYQERQKLNISNFETEALEHHNLIYRGLTTFQSKMKKKFEIF